MQLSEFKAWFEGYTESMKDVPSAKQWARIKERIAEIDGKPVSERVFIDRYWPQYWNGMYYPSTPTRTYTIGSVSASSDASNFNINNKPISADNMVFCSNTSMYQLGKAESSA